MIFSIWGEDKSCKTTLALTFPKPLVHMELDIGGFDRANRNLKRSATDKIPELNLPIQDWTDQGLIIPEKYIIPFQIGSMDPINNIIRPSKIIVGMKELFYQFAGNFIKHLGEDIATIVVDTGTLLYELTCQGYLQEKQEIQLDSSGNIKPGEKSLRVSLLPLEYREPYTRMRGFLYNAAAKKKNVVLTHHASDEYGPMPQVGGGIAEARTGNRVRHGWAQLGDSADVMVHTYWDSESMAPYCKVELAEVKELEGMVFKEPTYDKIEKVIKMIRGIAP